MPVPIGYIPNSFDNEPHERFVRGLADAAFLSIEGTLPDVVAACILDYRDRSKQPFKDYAASRAEWAKRYFTALKRSGSAVFTVDELKETNQRLNQLLFEYASPSSNGGSSNGSSVKRECHKAVNGF